MTALGYDRRKVGGVMRYEGVTAARPAALRIAVDNTPTELVVRLWVWACSPKETYENHGVAELCGGRGVRLFRIDLCRWTSEGAFPVGCFSTVY